MFYFKNGLFNILLNVYSTTCQHNVKVHNDLKSISDFKNATYFNKMTRKKND